MDAPRPPRVPLRVPQRQVAWTVVGRNFTIPKVGEERAASYAADCPTAYCGGDQFTLRVEAVNDDWIPDLASG